MTEQEIIEKVDKKIEELRNNKYQYEKVIEYFKGFFSSNKITVETLTELDLVDFIEISFIFMSTGDLNNQFLRTISKYLNNILLKIDNLKLSGEDYAIKMIDNIMIIFSNNMYFFGTTMDYLVDNNKIEDALEYLKEKEFAKINKLIEEDLDPEMVKRFMKIIKAMERSAKNDTESLRAVFKIYKEIPGIRYVFNIFNTVMCLKKEKEWHSKQIEKYEEYTGKKMKEKDRKKDYLLYIKKRYKDYINFVLTFKNMYQDKYSYFLTESKNYNRTNKKIIKNYLDFKNEFLKVLKEKEITNHQDLASLIDDNELKIEVLKYIYKHNEKYYEALNAKYQKLKSNTQINVIALLEEYRIAEYEYNIEKIMHNSYHDIKEILDKTSNINISKSVVRKILEESNLEVVKFIKTLIDKGMLDVKKVEEHSNIFIENDIEYLNLVNNLNTLEKNNYNMLNFSNDVLLMSNNTLEKNLNILEEYNLKRLIKGKRCYNFMKDNNLNKKIDTIIETGNEKILESDITILNEKNIERLYILKLLNIDISSPSELKNILSSTNFFIKDEEKFNYIPNHTEYYLNNDINLDLEIENYKYTNRSYKIGDIILSKIRVDNNLNSGMNIFESIITDCILDNDSILYLIENFKTKEKIKEKLI